jgi:inorganic pyrophosphatase
MGDNAPETVTCYIEIVPTDSVKYEIEKTTGYLNADLSSLLDEVLPDFHEASSVSVEQV